MEKVEAVADKYLLVLGGGEDEDLKRLWSEGIYCLKTYKEWKRANHPDKQQDKEAATVRFQDVTSIANKYFETRTDSLFK